MCIPDDEVEREFKVGYCSQDGIITRIEEKQKYIESFVVDSIATCKKCPFKYHCCGGCATIKLLSGNHDMFRKADYCEDFLRYIWTEILSRLFDINLNMIHSLPKKLEIDCCSNVFEENFWDKYVSKKISIEE